MGKEIHILFLDFSDAEQYLDMCFVFSFPEWTFSHHFHLECTPGSALSASPVSFIHSFTHSVLTMQTLCLRHSAGCLVFGGDSVPAPRSSGFSST